MKQIKHFTVSCYIVYKNELLLHKHKKLGIYIQIGGHIDENETPEEAVLREIKEETGLSVKLYGKNKLLKDKSIELNCGDFLNLHEFQKGHNHIDFVFFGKTNSKVLNPQKGESKDFIWVKLKDFKKFDLEYKVKKYGKLALKKASKNIFLKLKIWSMLRNETR